MQSECIPIERGKEWSKRPTEWVVQTQWSNYSGKSFTVAANSAHKATKIVEEAFLKLRKERPQAYPRNDGDDGFAEVSFVGTYGKSRDIPISELTFEEQWTKTTNHWSDYNSMERGIH